MNSLNPDTRIAVLARMIKASPGLGRTQLMKLCYFLQEMKGVDLGYDFRLFNYGPFDSEVLSDLATTCSQDAVVEKMVFYPRGYGYSITPGPDSDRLCRELEASDAELTSQIDEIVREFGSFGAAELELRSTIFFVDRELANEGEKVPTDTLVERVRQIKPHFDNATILQRVTEMARKAWLQSLSPSSLRIS